VTGESNIITFPLQPASVWDARDKDWWDPRQSARAAWLKTHGLRPEDTYRTEFYLIDTPFALVFRYHRNVDGNRHWTDNHIPGGPHDHDQCQAAVEPPVQVPLPELPPEELL
jgi:hypothetical protein